MRHGLPRRFTLIAIGLVVLLSAVYLAAERLGWADDAFFTARLDALRNAAPHPALPAIAIALLLASDLVLPIPSSIVMTLAGRFCGIPLGTLASFAGAMASALIGFFLCRLLGHRALRSLISSEDARRAGNFFTHYGAWGILLSRSVPMLTEIVSCVAGLSTLPTRTFIALAAAGTLPICAVYAWAGARATSRSGLLVAVLLAFLLPALGLAWTSSRRKTADRSP